MTPLLAAKATIRGIHEHHRTIWGRRDPLTGGAVTEQISLGWFIHIDFGPESGPISFCVGPERPKDVVLGQEIVLALFAADKPSPSIVK